jgi:hypothetical protein
MQTHTHAAINPEMLAGYKRLNPAARRRPSLSATSLAVLSDLGLTDLPIALYFRVAERRVASLRRYYGLA